MEEKVLIRGEFKPSAIFTIGFVVFAILTGLQILNFIIQIITSIIGGYFQVYYLTIVVVSLPFLAITIVMAILLVSPKKYELVVTDKRVYGKTLTKRIDLPFDSINSVSVTSNLVGGAVAISTSSGVIKFSYCQNKDDVHKAISQHLIERQNNQNVVAPVVSASSADELKKYKELLDMGAITQDEYDEKKKQLLGL